jgi:RNA polymerase sigma-70 factor (ECF subfamily)
MGMTDALESNGYSQDGDLVQRAQAGDADAFAEMYRKHVQAIYRYISYRVGEADIAEDLTSEVFLRAMQGLDRYRHRGAPLSAWLFRIARDRVADHYREQNRRSTDALPETLLDGDPGPEAEAVSQFEAAEVRKHVEQLTPDQRDVVYLRFSAGLSLSETAQFMGKTIGAIKALQFRALRTLARNLEI